MGRHARAARGQSGAADRPAESAEFAALVALAVPPAGASYVSHGLALPNPMELGFGTYDRLRAEMVSFDARKLGMRFDVPLFFYQGERDTFSVTSEVQRYADEIDAPIKRVVTIPGGGHSRAFLRNEMLAQLNEHVGPLLLQK